MPVRRQWSFNLILFLAVTAIALLGAEWGAKKFIPLRISSYLNSADEDWAAGHLGRRYTLTPGYQGRLAASEYEVPVRINEMGFRGPMPASVDLDPSSHPARIFVLGDSFVFGVGVKVEAALPARLEDHLQKAGREVEVWNLGTPSYSLPQYVLFLREYLQYEPQHVIVAVTAGRVPSTADDIYGAVDFEKWQALERGEEVTFEKPSAPEITLERTKRWFQTQSALYNGIIHYLGPELRAVVHGRQQLKEQDREKWMRGWEIADQTFAELAELAHEHGFGVTVVDIPEEADVIAGFAEIAVRLKESAGRYGFDYFNVFEFLSAQKEGDFYYPIDGHFTEQGNDALAGALAAVLHIPVDGVNQTR